MTKLIALLALMTFRHSLPPLSEEPERKDMRDATRYVKDQTANNLIAAAQKLVDHSEDQGLDFTLNRLLSLSRSHK